MCVLSKMFSCVWYHKFQMATTFNVAGCANHLNINSIYIYAYVYVCMYIYILYLISGGGVALRLWGHWSKLGSGTWRDSLITGNYRAASARRQILMFPAYRFSIYMLVPVVRSPVENRSCSDSGHCCAGSLIPHGYCQLVSWGMGHGLVVRSLGIIVGGGVDLRPATETGFQHMKRFAHNW